MPKSKVFLLHKIKQLTQVVIALLAITIAGSLSYLGHNTLSHLENIQNKELQKLSLLSQISSDIAQYHISIYEYLRSAQGAVDEGAFYDKGKPLLLKMHTFEDRMQAFINNNSDDVDIIHSLKTLLEKQLEYRSNTSNAILVATVNLMLADDLLNESTGFYIQLNKQFLNINRLIQNRLNQTSVQYREEFTYTSLLVVGFVVCLIFVSIFISRLLARRFQEKLLRLESLITLDKDMRQTSIGTHNEISILSSAIEIVEDNYKKLESSRKQQIDQNKLLAEQTAIAQSNAKELKDVNEELKNFAYIVSHDLKAPLRAINQLSGWIENDYAESFDDAGREQMAILRNRARLMHEMIEGILQYSRIGRVKVTHQSINLNLLFSDIANAIALPDHIKLEIQANMPEVFADKLRLYQVLQNLLDNAIKYNDKTNGLIQFNCKETEDEWCFIIQDNGIGIDHTDHHKVFQLFKTLVKKDAHNSTGLGLSMVEKSVVNWGGEISLESELGKGCTFRFTLPKQRQVNE